MRGHTELRDLLTSMVSVLADGEFVFVTIASRQVPAALRALGVFEESEGTTVICRKERAEAGGLQCSGSFRQITLSVHSSLDAVGFLAAVSTALADAGIPCNVVSAHFHDHLFVPAAMAHRALEVLSDLRRTRTEQT